MSYDLSVWCVKPYGDASILPESSLWVPKVGRWAREGQGWLLNVGPSEKVLPEDLPRGVAPALPGIEHLVRLSLEPSNAPDAGFKALRKAASAIAAQSVGAIFDPQTDTVELGRGIKRYVPSSREKGARVDVLEITWWFDNASLLRRESLHSLLGALQTDLPEGLPRRYGEREPPGYELAITGIEHLQEFLLTHLQSGVVWYPSPPVDMLSVSVLPSVGWQKVGASKEFRCNRLLLRARASTLTQAGWPTAFRRVWKNISRVLVPFYGDVRTLRGYLASLAGLRADRESEPPPTKSWWWKGLPTRLGHAAVLGEPYLRLWPDFARCAGLEGGLAFASVADWHSAEDLTEVVGTVPPNLAIPFMPYQETGPGGGTSTVFPKGYPETFPFSEAPL